MAMVLVIDDMDSIRKVIAERLKREGHKVLGFPDAAPALETVDFATLDLVITDLVMPTRGEEVIQAFRSQGLATPIIVLSGVLKPEDRERLTSMGASTVLAKPFKLMGLLGAMEQLGFS